MKRAVLIFVLLFMPLSYGWANFYIDGYGGFVQTGDTKNQYGGGFVFAYSIARDFNVLLKSTFAFQTLNVNDPDETAYKYRSNVLGIEYNYQIMDSMFYWRSSLGVGISNTQVNIKGAGMGTGPYLLKAQTYSSENPGLPLTNIVSMITANDFDDQNENKSGLSMGLWSGITFTATQHISPFIEVGYHKSLYTSKMRFVYGGGLEDANIAGIQVFFGVRFTVVGKNRTIFEDY